MVPQQRAPPLLRAKAKAAGCKAIGRKVKKHAAKQHQQAWEAGEHHDTTWTALANKWAGNIVDEDGPWATQQWKGQSTQSKDTQELDSQHKNHGWNGKQAGQTSSQKAWSDTYPGGNPRSEDLPFLPVANKVVLAQVNRTWTQAEVWAEVTRAAAPPEFMLAAMSSSPHHQAWIVAFAQTEEAACMLQAKSLPQGWMMFPYRPRGSAASEAVAAVAAAKVEVEPVIEGVMAADVDAEVEEVLSDVQDEAEAEVDPLQEEALVADFPLADLVLTWPVPAAQPGQQVTFLPIGLWQLPPAARTDWTLWTQSLVRKQVGVLAPKYRPAEGKWPCAVDCRPAGDPSPLPMQSRVHSGLHTKAVMDILADSGTCTHVLLQLQRAWQQIEFADHKVVALVDRTSGHEALSWARILAVVCRHLGYRADMDCSLVHDSFQQCLTICAAETASPGFMVIQAVRTWSALLPAYGLESRRSAGCHKTLAKLSIGRLLADGSHI